MKVKCLAQEHNTMIPELEPRPFDPESSMLTISSPHLSQYPTSIPLKTVGLEKKFDSQLAIWDWMWLVWGFAQWANEQVKLLAQQGNLLAPDNRTRFIFFFAKHCLFCTVTHLSGI